MKRILIHISCLFLILGSMAGCSAPLQGEPGGEAPVVVSVWYSVEGKDEQELVKQLERINNEHPEIIVNGVKIPETKFVEQVWNYQAGGEGPDIIITKRPIIVALYEKGAVSPVLADNYDAYNSSKAVFTFNNQPFAAPWLIDVPLLYYRKDNVPEPPLSMQALVEKKVAIVAKSFSTAMFGPWWQADGGSFTLSGLPSLDAQANAVFLDKILYLKSQKQLIFDNQALEKFIGGEVNYLVSWASDSTALTKAGMNWGSVSLHSLLGPNGKVLLDKTIGIANSSIKTVPTMEISIRLVQEELLEVDTETSMHKAGGYMPASELYYERAPLGSLNAEVASTISNAWYLEGYMPDWKLLSLQDKAWGNIIGGSKVESELIQIQQSAQEIFEKL